MTLSLMPTLTLTNSNPNSTPNSNPNPDPDPDPDSDPDPDPDPDPDRSGKRKSRKDPKNRVASTYPWGNKLTPKGVFRANIFQGDFPSHNTG